MDDKTIIDLFFARNEQAIKEADKAHVQKCLSVAIRILGNRADAEECVNDTWLKAWQSIPPEKPRSLSAYLCRIARNLAINTYHARKNHAFYVALDELSECLSVDERYADELKDLLNAFLATLPSLERRLFMGRYWHAYSVGRLAEAYDLTPNAVSLRLMRTREKLRIYLEERGITP
ncbi:MAG: sigma-70 family RNA polymerase sigma factor [Clostridia bacterium]|nr:sigma-70 family RNA polymerase sigma factor [Clostridia bacterium]MBQ9781439.1 sigma-70 family RNA polymerase sigma factor [Clostridia bacterium]